jgi:hypothetical protein
MFARKGGGGDENIFRGTFLHGNKVRHFLLTHFEQTGKLSFHFD